MNILKKIGIIKLSDSELIEEYSKTEDHQWVSELFSRYVHLVYGLCLKYLNNSDVAKDAVMEIYEKVLLSIKSSKLENVSAWLYTLSKNYCLNYLRNEKRRVLRELTYGKMTDSNEEDFTKDNNVLLLSKMLDKLKQEQRVCLQLFYFEDKSYEEISQLTGFTFKQVKSFLQNGKRNLKKLMEEKYEKE